MRRFVLVMSAVALLAVSLAAPALGAPAHRNPDVWIEIPIDPAVDQLDLENPCTGEIVTFFWEGQLLIHEVVNNNGSHANWQLFIDGYTSDGYVTDDGMHVALVINENANAYTYKDNSNYQYTNDAGSKFRMTYNERWTVVDGEVIVERLDPGVECVRYRG